MKILILLLIIMITGCSVDTIENTMPKPGQVWVYKSQDPFYTNPPSTSTVLTVLNGYVQYYTDSGHTNSMSICLYKVDAHMLIDNIEK